MLRFNLESGCLVSLDCRADKIRIAPEEGKGFLSAIDYFFILAVLISNRLTLPYLISFIKQDAEVIFSKLLIHMPILARKLMDAAAMGNKLKENIAVTCKEKVSKEKVKKLIDNIATSFGFDRQKFNVDCIAPKLS